MSGAYRRLSAIRDYWFDETDPLDEIMVRIHDIDAVLRQIIDAAIDAAMKGDQ